ncbi:tetratricopeptide repeat protein [Chryseobacterium sp. ERMR1:04]|uniref:tetratricopeptide repeat protein n=1 Tax=Chryseobacterium sp. ERMR1:04 TaxID=1705393 RepID=UPI0006C884B4|nr:tetratricopeptide repeat protein [Chryseobacterium sp. ERMR1:04]KPH13902.1 hypothetical protein AMQ68_10325 [Chryseobacterium sp. ERMR1:04]
MITTNNLIRNGIVFFAIILSNFAFCQDQFKKIDNLLQKAEKSRQEFNNLDQLKYAKQASVLAEKSGDSKKITECYYNIARALSFLELQKESFIYINKAYQEPYSKKSKLIQAQLKEVKAFNYYSLGLTSQFDKELPRIVKLLKGENDKEAIILLQRTYLNIGSTKPDSAKYYSQLCYNELKKLPEKDSHLELSDFYRYKGSELLETKPDSAFYYYQKSIKINQKYNDPILFFNYTSFGDYYASQKQYNEAIDYYEKAIQNIKDQSITPYHFVNNDLYDKISDLYGKLGNKEKQNEYQSTYLDLQKKLLTERNKNVEHALDILLKDKEEEYKTSEKQRLIWISIGVLVLIILFFFIYRILRKNLKHKETIIKEATSSLQDKEEIIYQKSFETQELQQKVNDAYTDVIELAKKNDPSFYFRFQEVYPEFQKKLLEHSRNLRTSELILCAYTFLGFTIKDIAEYTFKSVNTIRNRKQNLRKKFSMQTEEDMGIWLRNLVVNKE